MSKTIEPLSVKHNLLWNTIGCLFYLGCQWLTTILVVTLTGDYANSGLLAYAMAVGNIFAPIALYKIRAFQVSDLSGEYTSGHYLGFRLCTIVGAGLITTTYLVTSTDAFSFFLTSLIYLLFKADECLADVLYGIEQKNRRMDYIGKSQLLRGLLSLSTFCIFLLLSNDLNYAILAMFAACFCVTLFYDYPNVRLFGDVKPVIKKLPMLSLAKNCFSIMIASFFTASMVSIVRQYFGSTFGDEALGIYAAIATPAVLIQASASYLYSPTLVPITEIWKKGDHAKFVKTFSRIALALLLVIIALILVLSIGGIYLLPFVFGNSIQPYLYLLPFVLIGTGAIGLLWFINDVLIIMRSKKWLVFDSFLAFFICLTAMIPLINSFYMNGINYAIIFACLIGIILGLAGITTSHRPRKA